MSAIFTVRTGDLCELAALAYDSSEAGARRAAQLNKAAHVEYESAYASHSLRVLLFPPLYFCDILRRYIALSAQNIFESAGCLLVASAFMYLVPASLGLVQKARGILLGKMKLIGSRQASTEGREKAQDLSEFSTPEDMARHMVARAVKKTVMQVNANRIAVQTVWNDTCTATTAYCHERHRSCLVYTPLRVCCVRRHVQF